MNYTPMMAQYIDIKEKYKEHLLFFRLGDFYELFFEDSIKASSALDIVLTKKSCGKDEKGEPIKVDMCGVPFHSAGGYIKKLIEKGFSVAICEQTEDPKNMVGKIVKRDVVRIITKGTVIEDDMLNENKNNYIACLYEDKNNISIAICDVSTGEMFSSSFPKKDKNKVIDELAKYSPSEIICNAKLSIINKLEAVFNIHIYVCLDFYYTYDNAKNTLLEHFGLTSLFCFGIQDDISLICVCGALIQYLQDMQKTMLSHISSIKKITGKDTMFLDISSRKNLELTETLREKEKKGSLLWVLDDTHTPMGARLIRKWIEEPLINKDNIENRLNAVSFIKDKPMYNEELIGLLSSIKDMSRIIAKVSYETANARDLVALKYSFSNLPSIKAMLKGTKSPFINSLYSELDDLADIYNIIDSTIKDEPPFSIREGDMIKDGFCPQIDEYRRAKNEGTTWLLKLEQDEKEKTGIKNLKVRFNKVFGYYIEITNSNKDMVPTHYIRKQTLANCERYITDELKKIEETILTANEKINDVEYEKFCSIRSSIGENIKRIQKSSDIIAIIDVLSSFASVANKNDYCRPNLSVNGDTQILVGRHPVVELLSDSPFIPNDAFLNNNDNMLSIITGPNMAGKSTYMRQVALIVLMAQIGSFVPARDCDICIADRIFTRVGASDDLATGQSTFMVEMNEVSNILHNATDKSLLILDEIGRGTSTFDGLSIAWSVLEHIVKNIKARTLFATHYHEITELEGKLKGVTNYHVEIKDNGDDIVFLRKIAKGKASGSYGIHVAKLSGIPDSVISRAKDILLLLSSLTHSLPNDNNQYNKTENDNDDENIYYNAKPKRNILFVDEIKEEIKNIDINNITHELAFNKLSSIIEKIKQL